MLKQTKCEFAIVEALQFIFYSFFPPNYTSTLSQLSNNAAVGNEKMLQEGTEEEVETISPRGWF